MAREATPARQTPGPRRRVPRGLDRSQCRSMVCVRRAYGWVRRALSRAAGWPTPRWWYGWVGRALSRAAGRLTRGGGRWCAFGVRMGGSGALCRGGLIRRPATLVVGVRSAYVWVGQARIVDGRRLVRGPKGTGSRGCCREAYRDAATLRRHGVVDGTWPTRRPPTGQIAAVPPAESAAYGRQLEVDHTRPNS
jgi:hypothetical protein